MFNRARIKLTLWYLLIIMVISVAFSAVIYRVDINEVDRFDRIQRSRIILRLGPGTYPAPVIDPNLIEETRERLFTNLVLMNLAILVISGVSGYLLAGITLSPIKEMVDEQNRFISDASHEINTPLTSLKLALEVFLRGKKHTLGEMDTLAKESIVEVNKLQTLSHSLLQLSRFEMTSKKIKLEKVALKDILNQATKNISTIAKQKNITIENKIIDVYLLADKAQLIDLFTNLLENAIKYSPKGKKVYLETKKTDGYVVVEVRDEGIGIKKKDIPHIFDRFYRADVSRSKVGVTGGYGLGLSIAKKIVEAHRGSISVESVEDKGSRFMIKLPIK